MRKIGIFFFLLLCCLPAHSSNCVNLAGLWTEVNSGAALEIRQPACYSFHVHIFEFKYNSSCEGHRFDFTKTDNRDKDKIYTHFGTKVHDWWVHDKSAVTYTYEVIQPGPKDLSKIIRRHSLDKQEGLLISELIYIYADGKVDNTTRKFCRRSKSAYTCSLGCD